VYPAVSDGVLVKRYAKATSWRSTYLFELKVPSLEFSVLFEDVLAVVGWWVGGRGVRGGRRAHGGVSVLWWAHCC